MKPYLTSLASCALALCAAAALAPPSNAASGDPVAYKFLKSPVNSLGVKSLEDLRGKPVLIDFWGTR